MLFYFDAQLDEASMMLFMCAVKFGGGEEKLRYAVCFICVLKLDKGLCINLV